MPDDCSVFFFQVIAVRVPVPRVTGSESVFTGRGGPAADAASSMCGLSDCRKRGDSFGSARQCLRR